MEYQCRFIAPGQAPELVNLYHLARTALSGRSVTPYDRMLWASAEFAKVNDVTPLGAYKDLCGLLDR